MKKLYIYVCILAVAFSTACCEENRMDDYINAPAIYFDHSKVQSDSINYSFFLLKSSVLRDTVHVRINTMGVPADYDRPIKIEQTNVGKPNAAVGGVHFIAFDSSDVKDSLRIPAKAVYVDIPVILLRDESLLLEEKRLELKVVENEFFRLGIDDWRTFVVTVSDLVVKPKLWDSFWYNYFGRTWGVAKMRFIIDATGYTEWDKISSDAFFLSWLSITAKQALIDYNKAHPGEPLKEPNGDLVKF